MKYHVVPFSSIVGCGIFRDDDNTRPIVLLPPQAPAGVKFKDRDEAMKSVNIIRKETERIANICLKALNNDAAAASVPKWNEPPKQKT